MLYICLSCYQLKRGDEKQIDMNICEDCSSEPKEDNQLLTVS